MRTCVPSTDSYPQITQIDLQNLRNLWMKCLTPANDGVILPTVR